MGGERSPNKASLGGRPHDAPAHDAAAAGPDHATIGAPPYTRLCMSRYGEHYTIPTHTIPTHR